MATKKTKHPTQAANGAPVTVPTVNKAKPSPAVPEGKPPVEPVVEQARTETRPARKTKAELERQVNILEGQVARLKAELDEVRGPQLPWWEKIVGIYEENDPAFDEAMRLGREWRESFRPKKRSTKKKSRKSKSSDGRS